MKKIFYIVFSVFVLTHTIGGRTYSDHALDQMQSRGLTPSVVENTIRTGVATPSTNGRIIFQTQEARVVIESNGKVVTAMPYSP